MNKLSSYEDIDGLAHKRLRLGWRLIFPQKHLYAPSLTGDELQPLQDLSSKSFQSVRSRRSSALLKGFKVTMQTPFPSLIELLRLICNAFDAGRSIKKELDNKATDLYLTLPEVIEYLSRPELRSDFLWVMGNRGSHFEQFVSIVANGLKTYIDLIKDFDANGISRAQITPIIFGDFARRLLEGGYPINISTYPIFILDRESGLTCYSLPTLLNRLRKESLTWQAMLKHLTKQQSDMIGSWERGSHIPDLSSLKTLLSHPGMEDERASVMLARAWDYIIREFNQAGINPSTWRMNNIKSSFRELHNEVNEQIRDMLPTINIIERYFKKDGVKTHHAEASIHNLRSLIQKSNNPHLSDLFCDRTLARIRAQQEEFDECLSLYKNATEKSIYRGGCRDTELLLNEAMSAAAAIGPDRVFCKKLRKAQITFGYSANLKNEIHSKSKYRDHIQDWQIDRYAEEFISRYPSKKLKSPRSSPGPIVMHHKDIESIRYDYRKPNKIVSLKTKHGQKRMPQLAYAIYHDHWSDFLKLLDSGASVDIFTSAEESPLLLAIERMAPDTYPHRRDIRYFEYLSSIPHQRETIEKITSKRQLSALHSAINSGDPEIVKKTIDLGGSIDLIATANKCSPLYLAIGNTHTNLNPEGFLSSLKNLDLDTEKVDAIIRYNNFLSSKDSIKNYVQNFLEDCQGANIMEVIRQHIVDSHMSIPIENRIKIVDLLIEKGANINLEHSYPIYGYTPLMLAIEAGVLEVVKKMLKFGGDPAKTHYQPVLRRHVNCFDLAKLWNRREILQQLSSQAVS